MAKTIKDYKSVKDLPLYTAVYKLLWKTDNIMNNMDRDHKHTLGQYMFNLVLSMFLDVRAAQSYLDRREEYINLFLGKYDEISTLIKYCSERSYIKLELYVDTMPLLSNISRLAGGWLRHTQANISQSPSFENFNEGECIQSKAGLILPEDNAELESEL